MKRTILFFLSIALALPLRTDAQTTDSVYSPTIKTCLLASSSNPYSLPVIHIDGNDFLRFSFDELANQPHNFRYEYVHCDRNWRPDDLEPYEFINGFPSAPITSHEFSFTTLQPYVHYAIDLPGSYTSFLASGNYLLRLYREDDDSLVAVRRFCVTENNIDARLELARSASDPEANQEVSLFLSAATPSQSYLLNPVYLAAFLIQNGRQDLLREVTFSGYAESRLTYRFRPENIFPGGSCFRFFDISNMNTPMYNVGRTERFGDELIAILKPEEDRSRKAFSLTESLNGGLKINVWDRSQPEIEADYVWVNFSLPMKYPYLDGTVHLVGQLTDWSLGDVSEMEWNPRLGAYTKRIYVKQGYYAYQLVFKPSDSAFPAETARLEGDHSATPNTYTAFIYSRQPNERFDRLTACVSATF